MAQNLFTPNTIAVIWDFDKTLSPSYMQEPLFRRYGIDPEQSRQEIVEIGYLIDNTTKTRAIFEINKGTNKLSDIDVNATIAHEDRRIPFQNMIYVADGPSDVPAFSIINQYGGATFAVYQARNEAQFKQVANLQKLGRVQGIGEANYEEGSLTSMWLINAIEGIASRIAEDRERLLNEKVGRSPRHIAEAAPAAPATVSEVARTAIEAAEAEITATEGASEIRPLRSLPPQRASETPKPGSAGSAPAA